MSTWYPGSMARARRLVRENLALVDAVVEVLDARIPWSSRDPGLDRILRGKARLVVLNKADLADPRRTREWLAWLEGRGERGLAFNAVQAGGTRRLLETLRSLARGRRAGRDLRLMVAGIPNVGKSSLLNRLAGRARTPTGDRPGITRGKQWLTLASGLELLDLPGVLAPRPPRGQAHYRLAVAGVLPEGSFDPEEVARWLLGWLDARPAGRRGLAAGYGTPAEGADALEAIGRGRGCIGPGGRVDRARAGVLILKDFREGRLGRHTLERPGGDHVAAGG
ncbi:MAG: ribosome biogenesis GTPase YlqF [bacterium]|nr:ribosome biogenesis GTPase YlqF [bacterium]